jgi:hypothetical protein
VIETVADDAVMKELHPTQMANITGFARIRAPLLASTLDAAARVRTSCMQLPMDFARR